MPKIKSNRTASKKFKVTGSGRVKRAQANTSHNTAKKTPKQRRQHRAILTVDSANMNQVQTMLPYTVKN